jgi:hypothetical protein
MNGGNTLGHGVHDIQGIVVSHLWVPLYTVCCPFIFNATFFQAYLLPFIILRCFHVEAKVGILPNHEKQFPP